MSDSADPCPGRIARLPGQSLARQAVIGDSAVRISFERGQDIDPALLAGAFASRRATVWSNIYVSPGEPINGIGMRLAAVEEGTVGLHAVTAAAASDLPAAADPTACPAVVDGDSLAYLAARPVQDGEPCAQLGAIGRGPRGKRLARWVTDRVYLWGQRRDATPTVYGYRANAPAGDCPAALAVRRPSVRLHMTF